MHRIVLFGLDGAYATIPLQALAHAGLCPVLVVRGLDRDDRPWRPQSKMRSAKPGWFDRVAGRPQDGQGGWLDRWKPRPANKTEVAPDPSNALTTTAHQLGIDVLETSNANRREVVQCLERLRPDALVVCGFEHLLAPRVLNLARCGGINLHPGRLPQERGPAPLFWALRGGRTTLWWTIHMLDAGEDSGDRLVDGQISFDPGTDGLTILKQMAQAAAPAVVRTTRALLAGDLVRYPQAQADVARRPRPRFSDGQIDASKPAHAVFTFVGGCAARYSVFAEVAKDRFFIRRAISYDPDASLDFDFVLTGDRLILRCNPGVVELELKEGGAVFSPDF